MPEVTLVPMTRKDLDAFIEAQVADYARERVLDGSWSGRSALERAWAGLVRVIGWEQEAMHAERQRLLTAITSSGEAVGWLWVKLGPPGSWGQHAFLCQMTVERAVRRQGYGRAMLAALEAMLTAERFAELRLNVCETNLSAKALYDAAGFEAVAQHATMRQLRKTLTRNRESAVPQSRPLACPKGARE
jgi:ribosomal protein S18 acetylase RimI-like enzyme